MHFKIAEIKRAIFEQEMQEINWHMQELEANYDEKIVKAITNEVNFYIASERDSRLYRAKLLGGE